MRVLKRLLILLAGPVITVLSAQGTGPFLDVRLRAEPVPGARFSSGLTSYDEGLFQGRLVGRFWSATGRVRAEHLIADTEFASEWTDAFSIVMDGRPLFGQWRWAGSDEVTAERAGQRHVVTDLRHASGTCRVRVHTVLDGTPVLTRWLEVENTTKAPLAISSVAAMGGRLWRIRWSRLLPEEIHEPFEVGYFRHSGALEEGDFGWTAVPQGKLVVTGRNGKSGWGNPFFIARNQVSGEWFVCALGWSGEWTMELNRTADIGDPKMGQAESLFFRASPYAADPVMRVISPGETTVTPAVHIGHLTGNLDDVVHAMHDHVRRSVLPPQRPRRAQLVQDNHWGFLSGVEDEARVKEAIDTAASVGVELFIFDAGWYGNRRNDWGAQVGDWRPGPWLPNGLKPFVDHAHKKGLLFGLWMEPEAIGAHSRLLKEHPDFVTTRDGLPAYRGRALELAKPEVAAWVESEMARVIKEYEIDLFRLDYNVTDTQGGGNRITGGHTENTLWRRYEAFYGILGRLRRKFPNVIFENCASGGARTDLGILRYMDTTWISDNCTLPKSIKILNGMTMLLPPEICNRHFGTQSDDQRLYGDLDTQLRVTLFAHPSMMGLAPYARDLNTDYAGRIRHAIGLYKNFIRPMLPSSRVYHHTPVLPFAEAGDWCVLEYAASDKSRAYAGLFRLSSKGAPEYRFEPRGLKRSHTYKVTFDNSGETVLKSGLDLMNEGLKVRLPEGIRSELLLFETE